MSLQSVVPSFFAVDGNMDSFQALGLCEQAMHFDVEVSFQGSQPRIFDISTRDTVDKVKSIAHAHFCPGTHLEEYLLGITEKEKLEIEFVKFILAHVHIREDLESGELVRIGLFRKGVFSDTGAKEKIDLNTDINFQERRSSVSMGLSKLAVGGRRASQSSVLSTSSPTISRTPHSPKASKKDKEPEVMIVFNSPPTRQPLTGPVPIRPHSPPSLLASDRIKDASKVHKRFNSESSPIAEEPSSGDETHTSTPAVVPSSPPTPIHAASRSVPSSPVPASKQSSSTSALGKLVRGRRTLSVSTDINPVDPAFIAQVQTRSASSLNLLPSNTPPPSPPPRIFSLPILPSTISLSPLFDLSTKGFVVESGTARTQVTSRELKITDTLKSEPWYTWHFFGREHANFVGTDDTAGVFVVSVMHDESLAAHDASHAATENGDGDNKKDGTKVRAIVRTKKGDEKKTGVLKSTGLFKSKKISSKAILQSLCPVLSTNKLTRVKNTDLCNALKNFEERQLVKCYKFGVLYCKAGQTEEEQMFSNKTGSADWEEFLSTIGETVTLQGWSNYRAGLDVKGGSTGTTSVYTKYQGFEIMYHVSTMLPHDSVNMQQLERKRHIGNDIVVIVFKEGNQPYDPNCIKSEFNHIFAVVSKVPNSPDGKTYYNLSIACKEGVPHFKPELAGNAVFEKGELFKEFLLCKLINGENTSYEAPSFKIKIQRTRLALLKEIESKFAA